MIAFVQHIAKTYVIITAGVLTLTAVFAQEKDPEGFVLVRREAEIEVKERWVNFPGKTPAVVAREVKSEFPIRCKVDDIVAILQNDKLIEEWQAHVSKHKVYPVDSAHWFEYSYHDVPWPVSDQDSFLEYHMNVIKPGELIIIQFQSIKNHELAPVDEDVNRMELFGSWRLEKISPGLIRVTYRIQSMPGSMPRIVTDPVIRSNLMSTIKSLTELAERNNQASIPVTR